eukprot:gnl/Spiro4/21392_TR10461_c0_g1_i1.p1 gnl/Spiro4/21392_TR10461_c0_g1~~gnl/Spiro4/21392_TR10461_c0_g1_i1.p1  ORF type:complete len:364 (+),score=59.06 gnl/Spiro4/21392_TR10461_c0_g1_i1:30-1094(+)
MAESESSTSAMAVVEPRSPPPPPSTNTSTSQTSETTKQSAEPAGETTITEDQPGRMGSRLHKRKNRGVHPGRTSPTEAPTSPSKKGRPKGKNPPAQKSAKALMCRYTKGEWAITESELESKAGLNYRFYSWMMTNPTTGLELRFVPGSHLAVLYGLAGTFLVLQRVRTNNARWGNLLLRQVLEDGRLAGQGTLTALENVVEFKPATEQPDELDLKAFCTDFWRHKTEQEQALVATVERARTTARSSHKSPSSVASSRDTSDLSPARTTSQSPRLRFDPSPPCTTCATLHEELRAARDEVRNVREELRACREENARLTGVVSNAEGRVKELTDSAEWFRKMLERTMRQSKCRLLS